eukprot:TRINITY_DN6892_c0_g4_i2.p1 TRINITY_DN6892_c0_g4~~TRINITY_DN6892_c0_g4_i2.p1  ORF type:complete len:1124 (+),score=258.93 TRINITY_DN6892_c0_g4_i2:105-3476(+)
MPISSAARLASPGPSKSRSSRPHSHGSSSTGGYVCKQCRHGAHTPQRRYLSTTAASQERERGRRAMSAGTSSRPRSSSRGLRAARSRDHDVSLAAPATTPLTERGAPCSGWSRDSSRSRPASRVILRDPSLSSPTTPATATATPATPAARRYSPTHSSRLARTGPSAGLDEPPPLDREGLQKREFANWREEFYTLYYPKSGLDTQWVAVEGQGQAMSPHGPATPPVPVNSAVGWSSPMRTRDVMGSPLALRASPSGDRWARGTATPQRGGAPLDSPKFSLRGQRGALEQDTAQEGDAVEGSPLSAAKTASAPPFTHHSPTRADPSVLSHPSLAPTEDMRIPPTVEHPAVERPGPDSVAGRSVAESAVTEKSAPEPVAGADYVDLHGADEQIEERKRAAHHPRYAKVSIVTRLPAHTFPGPVGHPVIDQFSPADQTHFSPRLKKCYLDARGEAPKLEYGALPPHGVSSPPPKGSKEAPLKGSKEAPLYFVPPKHPSKKPDPENTAPVPRSPRQSPSKAEAPAPAGSGQNVAFVDGDGLHVEFMPVRGRRQNGCRYAVDDTLRKPFAQCEMIEDRHGVWRVRCDCETEYRNVPLPSGKDEASRIIFDLARLFEFCGVRHNIEVVRNITPAITPAESPAVDPEPSATPTATPPVTATPPSPSDPGSASAPPASAKSATHMLPAAAAPAAPKQKQKQPEPRVLEVAMLSEERTDAREKQSDTMELSPRTVSPSPAATMVTHSPLLAGQPPVHRVDAAPPPIPVQPSPYAAPTAPQSKAGPAKPAAQGGSPHLPARSPTTEADQDEMSMSFAWSASGNLPDMMPVPQTNGALSSLDAHALPGVAPVLSVADSSMKLGETSDPMMLGGAQASNRSLSSPRGRRLCSQKKSGEDVTQMMQQQMAGDSRSDLQYKTRLVNHAKAMSRYWKGKTLVKKPVAPVAPLVKELAPEDLDPSEHNLRRRALQRNDERNASTYEKMNAHYAGLLLKHVQQRELMCGLLDDDNDSADTISSIPSLHGKHATEESERIRLEADMQRRAIREACFHALYDGASTRSTVESEAMRSVEQPSMAEVDVTAPLDIPSRAPPSQRPADLKPLGPGLQQQNSMGSFASEWTPILQPQPVAGSTPV